MANRCPEWRYWMLLHSEPSLTSLISIDGNDTHSADSKTFPPYRYEGELALVQHRPTAYHNCDQIFGCFSYPLLAPSWLWWSMISASWGWYLYFLWYLNLLPKPVTRVQFFPFRKLTLSVSASEVARIAALICASMSSCLARSAASLRPASTAVLWSRTREGHTPYKHNRFNTSKWKKKGHTQTSCITPLITV